MGLEKIPFVGGAFDQNDEEAKRIYKNILDQYQGVGTPDLTFEEYRPEDLQSMGEYSPEMAQYQQLQEDPRLLGQQEAYLKQLKAMSEQGFSPEDAAVFDQAQKQSAQQARGSREATMANMNARGVGGSGMELLSKEIANQQAAERSRSSMMEQAAAAARQKALYSQAYGGELGDQRSQNLQTESANKNIINRFNELNTGNRNEAAQMNLAQRQAIANANAGQRNTAQQYNQQGRSNAKQQMYQNQLSKLAGVTGAQQQQAQSALAQSEANAATRGAGEALAGKLAMSAISAPSISRPKKKVTAGNSNPLDLSNIA